MKFQHIQSRKKVYLLIVSTGKWTFMEITSTPMHRTAALSKRAGVKLITRNTYYFDSQEEARKRLMYAQEYMQEICEECDLPNMRGWYAVHKSDLRYLREIITGEKQFSAVGWVLESGFDMIESTVKVVKGEKRPPLILDIIWHAFTGILQVGRYGAVVGLKALREKVFIPIRKYAELKASTSKAESIQK